MVRRVAALCIICYRIPLQKGWHGKFKNYTIICFNITDRVRQNEVDEAVLNVHVQELDSSNTTSDPDERFTINLQVSRVKSGTHGSKVSVAYSPSSVEISRKELRAGKLLKINVTTLLVDFCRFTQGNLAIFVKAQDSENKTRLVVTDPNLESNKALIPYIEVCLRDNSHKRTRRTLGMDCTEDIKEDRCCRYPLIVDFEEFGWDWVIAPKDYNAYYCSGKCPYSFLQRFAHTHIVHMAGPPGSGVPCCTSRKLSPISMLFFDHDFNIIYAVVPGMVVESCGCL